MNSDPPPTQMEIRNSASLQDQIAALGGQVLFVNIPRSGADSVPFSLSLEAYGQDYLLAQRRIFLNSRRMNTDWRANFSVIDLEIRDRQGLIKKRYPSLSLYEEYGLSVEDPRIIKSPHGFELWASVWDTNKTRSTTNQARFVLNGSMKIEEVTYPAFGRNLLEGHEKNWLPHAGKEVVTYSVSPRHQVYSLATNKGYVSNGISWAYGEPHGSSPSISLGRTRLGFFHSSVQIDPEVWPYRHLTNRVYFVGAYEFTDEAPYRIIRASSRPIFQSSPNQFFMNDSTLVTIPFGLVREGSSIILSFGINDSWNMVAQLPLKAMSAHLSPVDAAAEPEASGIEL